MDETIKYALYGVVGGGVLIGLIVAISNSGVDLYTLLVVLQVMFVIIAMVIGFTTKASDATQSAATVSKIATAAVIYLPISLAMFSVIGSVLFQNSNFLIPVLAGLSAVALNLGIDKIVSQYGNQIMSTIFTKK